jgi:hypothetical protein
MYHDTIQQNESHQGSPCHKEGYLMGCSSCIASSSLHSLGSSIYTLEHGSEFKYRKLNPATLWNKHVFHFVAKTLQFKSFSEVF